MRFEQNERCGDDLKNMMSTKYDNTVMNDDGGASAYAICTFTKKGHCKLHKIKGDVSRNKTKVWRKKKFGYGWVTTTVVSYTCSRAGMTTMDSIGLDGISQGRSPESANSKGDIDFVKQPGVSIGGELGQE